LWLQRCHGAAYFAPTNFVSAAGTKGVVKEQPPAAGALVSVHGDLANTCSWRLTHERNNVRDA
jgi:hypothetical protein